MKRSHALVISCICALMLALFGLSACGGSSGSSTAPSSTSASSSSSAAEGESSDDSTPTSPEEMSEDDIRPVFEQLVASMSEYYKGTTPAGEELYYAGGADGANAVLALIVPNSSQSAIFVGPATVEENTNKLTISDETTGSTISFFITSNDDGTISFSMGEEYGAATMAKCSSADIVDTLTMLVQQDAANADAAAEAEGAASAEQADQQ